VTLDIDAWDAWRPEQIADLLAAVELPWAVAAGWAIDLFLGGGHRAHGDLEIAVPRPRFGELLPVLDGFELWVPVGDGKNLMPFDPDSESHQTWARDPATEFWRFDVFREPADGDTWICRRDERLRMRYSELIRHTPDGIPYVRPDVTLLFKARHSAEDKNEADFAAALPLLSAAERTWLRDALALVHPGHEWATRL
jgi:hypothetical protein